MLESTFVFNSLTMNDGSKARLNSSPFYWIQFTSIDGLFGADIGYEEHDIPGAIGTKSGDVFRRAKTITVSGFVWGANLTAMRNGQFALAQALADRAIYKLTFTPSGTGFTIYIKCRLYQDLVMPEAQTDMQMRRSFTFSLRADDPRSYKTSDDSLWPTWQSAS